MIDEVEMGQAVYKKSQTGDGNLDRGWRIFLWRCQILLPLAYSLQDVSSRVPPQLFRGIASSTLRCCCSSPPQSLPAFCPITKPRRGSSRTLSPRPPFSHPSSPDSARRTSDKATRSLPISRALRYPPVSSPPALLRKNDGCLKRPRVTGPL